MQFQWRRDDASGITEVTLTGAFGTPPWAEAATAALHASGAWRDTRVLLDIRGLDVRTVPGYGVLSARVEHWVATAGAPERVAVLVSDTGVQYGIGRMLIGASGSLSDRIDLFTTREAAMTWLLARGPATST